MCMEVEQCGILIGQTPLYVGTMGHAYRHTLSRKLIVKNAKIIINNAHFLFRASHAVVKDSTIECGSYCVSKHPQHSGCTGFAYQENICECLVVNFQTTTTPGLWSNKMVYLFFDHVIPSSEGEKL